MQGSKNDRKNTKCFTYLWEARLENMQIAIKNNLVCVQGFKSDRKNGKIMMKCFTCLWEGRWENVLIAIKNNEIMGFKAREILHRGIVSMRKYTNSNKK
jgi:hypothetical protein